VALAADGEEVGPAAMPLQLSSRAASRSAARRTGSRSSGPERDAILHALRSHGGNQSEAARSLGGMKRTTLLYKIKKLDIRPEEYGRPATA
jgi:transcriptional regulator of acetoin/glycerol metabolism